MKDNNNYQKSLEIEVFLLRALDSNPGTKTGIYLKSAFKSLIYFENGQNHFWSSSQYEKEIVRLLKYFGKAINTLSKKHSKIAVNLDHLKQRMDQARSSQDIFSLYSELKGMMD